MAAFALVWSKSLISRFWATSNEDIPSDSFQADKAKVQEEKHWEQNKRFLNASKNGGIWFS